MTISEFRYCGKLVRIAVRNEADACTVTIDEKYMIRAGDGGPRLGQLKAGDIVAVFDSLREARAAVIRFIDELKEEEA